MAGGEGGAQVLFGLDLGLCHYDLRAKKQARGGPSRLKEGIGDMEPVFRVVGECNMFKGFNR